MFGRFPLYRTKYLSILRERTDWNGHLALLQKLLSFSLLWDSQTIVVNSYSERATEPEKFEVAYI